MTMTDGRSMIGSKTRFETSVYKTHKNGIMISAAKKLLLLLEKTFLFRSNFEKMTGARINLH